MSDLKHREAKMQEARKNTPRREFVKEICSWQPLVFHRNNGVVSRYPQTERTKGVTTSKEFDMQRMGSHKGVDYDIDRSFFEQYFGLTQRTVLPAMWHFAEVENCDFSDTTGNAKNVYLSNTTGFSIENILYSFHVRNNCYNVLNSVAVWKNNSDVYQSSCVIHSFKIYYSRYIQNSSDIWFCSNMQGCQECLFCNDLQNASYYIQNKQYTKEEYYSYKEKLLQQKQKFEQHFCKVNKIGNNTLSENVSGSFVIRSKDVHNGIICYQLEKGNNVVQCGDDFGEGDREIYDAFVGGIQNSYRNYGVMSGGFGTDLYNLTNSSGGNKLYYCNFVTDCSYCLGCIGLKNKSFCILNKQYTKEERHEKANEIFAQMEKDGQLGKFFPPSMNPFYFNDTVAYLIDDSFTKEEVEAEGFLRRDEEIKVDIPEGAEVVQTHPNPQTSPPTPPSSRGGETSVISPSAGGGPRGRGKDLGVCLDDFEGYDADGNRFIDPEIMKKVIIDEKGNAYKIVKMEYDFLMKHGLPLPRLHRLDRIKLGFQFK